ncbi:MAG TPA: hypothetical protein VEG30_11380 [Terriglobales bacterium]|nr:hypothetical protein [Terriglobales bacterium]
MILFISSFARSHECAAAVEAATREKTLLQTSLRAAIPILREQEFAAVVIDESVVEAQSDSAELLLENLGPAAPVFINLAIRGTERMVEEVRAALRRRKQEHEAASRHATAELHSQLASDLTGLLLAAQVALKSTGLSAEGQQRLSAVCELAEKLKNRLDPRGRG